jgi:hypothetical protein
MFYGEKREIWKVKKWHQTILGRIVFQGLNDLFGVHDLTIVPYGQLRL